jgi:CheY-like chemotaxis protein
MATVLCTGVDRVLNETRALILRQAGHSATWAMDEHEVIHACKEHTFDVVVVGQAMSDAQKLHIFELVRQHCKSAKILELYLPFSGRALKQADGWLEVPAKVPSDLAVHVERLTGNGAAS